MHVILSAAKDLDGTWIALTKYYMPKLFILPSAIAISLFYTTVYAQYSCRDLFSTKILPKTIVPSASTESVGAFSHVYRTPELLNELVHNKKYPMLEHKESKNGHHVRWFLSVSNKGRLYRFVMRTTNPLKPQDRDIYADIPTQHVESLYYHQAAEARHLQPVAIPLTLPQRGRKELTIPAHILVKLDLKHNINAEELVSILQKSTRYIKLFPNNDSHFEGKDSFKFFIDIPGHPTPLIVILLQENNTYTLITAFFPDVDTRR